MKKKRQSPSLLRSMAEKSFNRLLFRCIPILILFLLLSFQAFAQPSQRITLEVKDKALGEVLKDISSQTGIEFFYSNVQLDRNQRVTFSVTNATVEETMARMFAGKSVDYDFEDGVLVIKSLNDIPKTRQKKNITGIVRDAGGQPIIGASVVEKGTTNGVLTGIDGSFSMEVWDDSVLEVSYLGMEKQEVGIGAATNYQISLMESAQTLEDVVVTGMTTMDRRLFTGATDKLAADAIKLDGIADISRGLEGRSAGVSVQNVSATFGTAPKIRIRGSTSILGNSKPLWVVDGVIMEDIADVSTDDLSSGDALTLISSAVAGLNAEDIESFQILKDGSATSIYGARAMPGVIVITTKRGTAGVTRINYSGEFSIRMKPKYSEYDIMNSQDQMGVYNDMQEKGWLNYSGTYRAKNSGVYGHMYHLLAEYDKTSGQFGLPNTSYARTMFLRDAEMRNTDWFDILFRNSVSQTHSVSITTGTEKSSSYLSMSVMSDPGWYKQSSVDRYTANANHTYNILKNLSLSLNSNASYRKQRAPGTIGVEYNTVSGEVSRNFDINPFSYAMNTSRTLEPGTFYIRDFADFNILHELDNNYIDLKVIQAKFQGELKWTIIPGLTASALGAFQYQSSSQAHKITEDSNFANAYRAMKDTYEMNNNNYLYSDPELTNQLPVSVLEDGGFYRKSEYRMSTADMRVSANWNKTFNGSHIVNMFGAMEIHSVRRSNDWFEGWGMLYNYGELAYFNYLAFKKLAEENRDYYTLNNRINRSAAYIFNGTYSYLGKYVLNGTFRYEGTNRLGKNRTARWLPTWNIAGAWNVHEEGFFKMQNALTNLTFKLSYSLTGDSGPSSVSNSTHIVNSYTPWRLYTADREVGLEIDRVGNSELTYEKKHELNIGLNATFIDRINLAMDVYFRNNYDLIGLIYTQGVGGEISKYANIADMESKGLEVTVSTQNIVTKDFRWSTDLTFSWAKNKVTDYKSSNRLLYYLNGNTGYSLEGFPASALFSIPFIGLDDQGLPMFEINGKVVDKNNYGDINFQSTDTANFDWLKYEGPTEAPYAGGFSNNFKYKNFTFNVFLTYAFGNKIRMSPIYKYRYTDLDSHSRAFKNRWMVPGDEDHTIIPALASSRQYQDITSLNRAYNAYNYSTARVAKGDFIRLKELSLTYDLPREWVSRINMQNMSVRFAATNLFLLYADSKLNGQDPEYYQSGGVSSPLAKQFTFTLKFGF